MTDHPQYRERLQSTIATRADLEAHLAQRTISTGDDAYTLGQFHRTASPIEEALATALQGLLDHDAALIPELQLRTRLGEFRPDFILWTPGQITALECDGATYHPDPIRDDARDAALLESGMVDKVIRLPADLLRFRPKNAVWAVAQLHPAAFGPRGQQIADRNVSDFVRAHVGTATERLYLPYPYPARLDEEHEAPAERVGGYHAVQVKSLEASGPPTRVRIMAAVIGAGQVRTIAETIEAAQRMA